jgi:tetratricopeptide (TPR) repeat protein
MIKKASWGRVPGCDNMVRQAPEIGAGISQKGAQESVAAALALLQSNEPARAEQLCRAFLATSPGSVEHLRLLGHALSKQSRYVEAEDTTRLAISLKPEFPHLYEDLGSVLALQQRYAEAVASFEHAIRLEPQLPLAHKKLGQALAAMGRGQEADAAFEEFFDRDARRGKVALALDHVRAGRKTEAMEMLRAALRENPDNVDAMRYLAALYWREKQQLSDAEALLRRATQQAPGYTAAWVLLGVILHEADRYAESIECFTTATQLEPANPAAWTGRGNAYAHMGNVEQAIAAFEKSLSLYPDAPNVQLSYGHVLKTRGDQAAALRAYRAAIAGKSDFGEVYWSMANLKVFRFEDSEIAAMEQQLANPDLSESADIHFRFALAKAYEDRRDYDRAWHFYETGNQRQRKRVSHDPVATELRHEQIAAVFTRELFDRHANQGYESAAPIFIVGLPRSGSTLVEQILASHSQVEGTAELPTLMRLAYSIGRYRSDNRQYPETVLDLRGRDFRAYGRQYIDEARAFRATDRPFFTDKLPNNFSHVGLAHLILPNARIINARRHPFDSCLGGFKQLFGKGQNFTYDMQELASYYRQYHQTMRHWHQVLPGKVLDVHYEETVLDLETQVRRILAHCGLPFEEGCVRFHENTRAVRTASSEQVRQPIYRGALGHWRRFDKHLDLWREEFADILAELPETVRNAGA